MCSDKLTVSVLMSVFNGEKYLRSSIQSMLEQTMEDFEFIITNDGSTDGTAQILKDIAIRDQRIKILNRKNQGLTNSLNELVEMARGEFIARMDADDIAYPDRLRLQAQYLQEHPDVGLVGCWTQIVTANGIPQSCYCFPDDHEKISSYLNSGHNPFIHPSIMMRSGIFDLVSPPYRFRNSQDFDLWLRLQGKTRFGVVEKLLFIHRKHGDQVSASYGKRGRSIIKLMVDLHEQRKNGEGDENWQLKENQILNLYPIELPIVEASSAKNAYTEAVSLQINGGPIRAIRQLMIQAMKYSPIKQKAFFHFMLTFLPVPVYRAWYDSRSRRALRDRHYRLLDDVLSSEEIQDSKRFWDYINGFNHR